MNRYTVHTNTNQVVTIIDTSTGRQVCVCGNAREANTFVKMLHTNATKHPHRTTASTPPHPGTTTPAKALRHPKIAALATKARNAITAQPRPA